MNNNPVCEDAPCCGCCGQAEANIRDDDEMDARMDAADEMEHRGWPGDGSGEDDLADYNANEADDYANEGGEDSYLDSSYEDRFEIEE